MGSYFEMTLLMQVISALLIGWIMLHYARVYEQNYLRLWSFSFGSLAVFLLGAMLASFLIKAEFSNTSVARLSNIFVFTLAGYLQIIFLLAGTRELVQRKTVSKQFFVRWVGVAVVLALFVTFYKIWSAEVSVTRYSLRIGTRYAVAGIAFLVTAVFLYRSDPKPMLGKKMVTICFAIYGLEMLVLGGLTFDYMLNPNNPYIRSFIAYHGLFELVIYPMIGISLVIWLLEVERERSLEAAEQLYYINRTDGLTGLANRQGLQQHFQNWQRNAAKQSRATFVLFGIDQLQRINDAEGIKKGDQLLISMGKRLSIVLEDARFHGRLHGDVFVAIFDGYNKKTPQKVEEIRQQLSKAINYNGQDYHLEMSAGVVEVESGLTLEKVLHMANQTLQTAKAQGGHCTVVFGENLKLAMVSDLAMENELRAAFENNQFELLFQPIWSAQQKRIISFEALIRWNHPEKGLLLPDSFLHILRQLGLMEELDLWVLNAAAQQISHWQQLQLEEVNVAVNLSPETIQNHLFVERIIEAIHTYQINKEALTIEVTENTAMQNIESGKNTLSQLRSLGLKIAIDDFGTGYSSLNYLRSFPSDVIKFDRSFVRDLHNGDTNHEILMALIPLCKRLHKKVIIEGIENQIQLDIVENLNIDGYQGFYFSYPVTSDKAALMLAKKQKLAAV